MKNRYINGKPVVDATAPAVINVKWFDIDTGVPGDADNCALAKGACRTRGVKSAKFLRSLAYIEYDDKWVRYELTSGTRAAIALFDSTGGHAIPGTFDIIPPRGPNTLEAITRKSELMLARANRGEVPKSHSKPYAGRKRRYDPSSVLGIRSGTGAIRTSMK